MLLLPQGANQFTNAERAEALGVARCLGPPDVRPEAVRVAVRALLDDPSYRQRARAVAEEIAAMPSPGDVVPGLEELAAAGAVPG